MIGQIIVGGSFEENWSGMSPLRGRVRVNVKVSCELNEAGLVCRASRSRLFHLPSILWGTPCLLSAPIL